MYRTSPRIFFLLLLPTILTAQSAETPAFNSATNLVLVPFNVESGRIFLDDLQSSDFTLREDGHPRAFTIFEGPHTAHPLPLEFDLLFDTSVIPKNMLSAWNAKATYEFLNDWDESITRDIVHQDGMDVRVAVYHYSANQWERLCAGTSDPREIMGAFQRLLNPILPGTGELTLLPGSAASKGPMAPPGWLQEATAATLKDAAASSVPARRILLLFSEGWGRTVPMQLDRIAEQSIDVGIPIVPVMLGLQLSGTISRISGGGADSIPLYPVYRPNGSVDHIMAPPSVKLGEMTGGETLVPLVPERLDRHGLASALLSVRNKMLSEYVIGFVPGTSEHPRKHKLEVELNSKTSARLINGERDGVVY